MDECNYLTGQYQGELYLKEQLESILSQTYKNWTLLISDDGSSDNTLTIIEQFKHRCTQTVDVISGPSQGPTKNFFNLINNASTEKGALYAYCDQDDVWYPNKLSRAVGHYEALPNLLPSQAYLYCGRTQVVNHTLAHLGFGSVPRKPLGFGNALLQNVAGGNTMLFNSSVLKTLQKINPQYSVLHDWTTYQVATGIGGIVYFDYQPTVAYRQHENNVVGAVIGWFTLFEKLKSTHSGQHREWAKQTLKTMSGISECLSPQSRKILASYDQTVHHPNWERRIEPFIRKKIWHQKFAGLIVYFFIALFCKDK